MSLSFKLTQDFNNTGGSDMVTLKKATITVFVASVSFGVYGSLIGYLIGTWTPNAYLHPDPPVFGMSLGLRQGAVSGVATGLVVVGLLCWRDLGWRRVSLGLPPTPLWHAFAQTVFVATAVLLLFFVGGAGCIAGALFSSMNEYSRQSQMEFELVSPILSHDPAYSSLRIERLSSGGISISGHVPSEEDRERLKADCYHLFGERRAKEICQTIDIRNPTPPKNPINTP
jgi:hypothetical protein